MIRLVKIVALACASTCVLASTHTQSRDSIVRIEGGAVQGTHSAEFPNLIFFAASPMPLLRSEISDGDLRNRRPDGQGFAKQMNSVQPVRNLTHGSGFASDCSVNWEAIHPRPGPRIRQAKTVST